MARVAALVHQRLGGGVLGADLEELVARRVLLASGLPAQRVIEVRGLADRHLRDTDNPLSPANRRITILLPFTVLPDGTPAGQTQAGG